MKVTVYTSHVVTVHDRLLRRRYGCVKRGATWHSDAGPVSPRVQRAIERAQRGQQIRSLPTEERQ